jgi:hypothetical protein
MRRDGGEVDNETLAMEDSAGWNEKAARTSGGLHFSYSEHLNVSVRNPEHHVTFERTLVSLHLDRAGGRP